MIDLDELQSVRDRERQTDKLQQLRPTFYADAGEFIQQLREQRQRAADRAEDPFDAPEVGRLSDEIDTAEQTVEAIYEKRVGKIVKAASFAAADLPAESDGMTDEEADLFETLVADIKSNRQHVLDVLAGEIEVSETDQTPDSESTVDDPEESSPTQPDPPAESSEPAAPEPPSPPESPAESALADGPPTGVADEPTEVSAADLMGSESNAETSETDPAVREDGGTATRSAGVERETVRITADVGDIFGVDEREYDLAEDDVVTLPEANAKPLVERDAAERL